MLKKSIPKGSAFHPHKKNKRINQRSPKAGACLIALLALIMTAATAFGQGAVSASLGGTIDDSSGSVIPGAAVIARNTDTGVEARTTTNNSGVYNFPSLQSGTYELAVEAPGFQRSTRTDIRLGLGQQARLSVTMAVAGTVTEIAVSGTVESVILEAGSSTGTVIQENVIQSIPLLSGSVLDLVNIIANVTPTNDPVFGGQFQTFAGSNANQINITRDGVSVNEVRFATGIQANTNINQEMIGEFKMVLSPVDAEMGRGAGQVQMTTRSGSNAFHGSAVWNVQNTVLDARDFSQKRIDAPPGWRNLNSYLLTASGPVIKNRTFFFVTWEQQFSRERIIQNLNVMTPCARKGIYRYIGGYVPAARNEGNTYNPGTMAVPSVNENGRPLETGTFFDVNNPDRTLSVNSSLYIESIFGNLNPEVRSALLDDKGERGVYGNCEDIPFLPASNPNYQMYGTDTAGLYGTYNGMQFLQNGTYWGSYFPGINGANPVYRNAYDPTGYVTRFTYGTSYMGDMRVEMPPANNYDSGDGLNRAAYRWAAPYVGGGGSLFGGSDPDRKSITFKIDHNINASHRVSGAYTLESNIVRDYYGYGASSMWPESYGGYNGSVDRRPQTGTFSATSTLRPTLLNEARMGFSSSDSYTKDPMSSREADKMNAVLEALMPPSLTQGRMTIVGPGEGSFLFHVDPVGGSTPSHPVSARGLLPITWGGVDYRWTISDTMTWMKGAHSFKGGFEYRKQGTDQGYTGDYMAFANSGGITDIPSVYGGLTTATNNRRLSMFPNNAATSDALAAMGAWQNLYAGSNSSTGLGNWTTPFQMMSYFAGSVLQTRQFFFGIPNPDGTARWNDSSIADEREFRFKMAAQEFSFFFKDDWKVTSSLTLNLGVRYEYYGVPHIKDGRTLRLGGKYGTDSVANAFGITPGGWNNWMVNREYAPAAAGYLENAINPATGLPIQYVVVPTRPDPVSQYEYVGPGSNKSDIMAWNRDLNNFAPHLGFSWELPWFGRGLTTLRGGWSISYSQLDPMNLYTNYIGYHAGASNARAENFQGVGSQYEPSDTAYYMDLTDLAGTSILSRNGGLTPSTEILPMGVKYVGMLNPGSAYVVDPDAVNPRINNLNLSLTRNVGRSLTVDVRYVGTLGRDLWQNSASSINQSNWYQTGLYKELETVRNGGESELLNSLISPGTLWAGNTTGSQQLRDSTATRSNLAYGNFASVVSSLMTTNGILSQRTTTEQGLVARLGCLPQDRAVNGNIQTAADYVGNGCTAGTPWNYYATNPQYQSITVYHSGLITNYHSMQAQVTMRPTRGLSFQATYTWSRNLGNSGWTDYTQDIITGRDYTLSGQHRSHALSTYGSYELPFGANGFFFHDASGFFKKAIEGWQLNWVTSMASGAPASVTGQATLWNNSWPNLVRPDLWDDKAGKAVWEGIDGSYFGSRYVKVLDENLCDKALMDPGLFTLQCVNTQGAVNQSAPRAMALADSDGNPQRYATLDEALKHDPLARMELDSSGNPTLMPSVIVFRSADQRDGLNARGNYSPNRLTGPGRFSFDMAMSKSVEFMEGKRFEIRIDAQNILNHAMPTNGTSANFGGRFQSINNPNFAISSTAAFGRFTTKAGHRTFQARLRLSF